MANIAVEGQLLANNGLQSVAFHWKPILDPGEFNALIIY